jgi:SAM-dependent MidA family methyltransferase
LGPFGGQVHWAERLGAPGLEEIHGVVFANELLDAMPCHQVVWDSTRQEWKERGIREEGPGFAWECVDLTSDAASMLRGVPEEMLGALPNGFTTEVCPAALRWVECTADLLRRGWLVLFDYGFGKGERWAPHRSTGTLRAYSRHQVSEDVLKEPGGQDITASVDFDAVQSAGEARGLVTHGLWRQEVFLTKILEEMDDVRRRAEAWDSNRRRQFQTLVHPQHLGHHFRVLVQSRIRPVPARVRLT